MYTVSTMVRVAGPEGALVPVHTRVSATEREQLQAVARAADSTPAQVLRLALQQLLAAQKQGAEAP